MRPSVWSPPVEPSAGERAVMKRVRRAKLFVFLRERRNELFDEAFQRQLGEMYADAARGHPPVPPAQLALATILQAYTGVSDDEVIECTVMDRRWQLVLDCPDAEDPPFSKGTLVSFRERLIGHDMDRRLVERTVEVAGSSGGFGPRALRAALDSSPLWGAGRVEDTYNLMGHALRKALGVIACRQGRGLAEVAEEAGASVLAGSSLKAALDCAWDDPEQRRQALVRVLDALDSVETYLGERVETARRVREQDVEEPDDGAAHLCRGVAKDRRISVEDAEMRHGRKSRSQLFDGYKRHALRDLDTGLVRAVGVTAANAPEASVTGSIAADLASQGAEIGELHIDRAYLGSEMVRDRPGTLEVYCKAWLVQNGDRYPKTAFGLDWEARSLRCPAGVSMPFEPGGTVRFPADTCNSCLLKRRCTGSERGRSVSIHPDERLLAELRARQHTSEGRAKLRERVAVEHSLAHIGRWQGDRARYLGVRKNLLDLRRSAVVHNLHVIARTRQQSQPQAA